MARKILVVGQQYWVLRFASLLREHASTALEPIVVGIPGKPGASALLNLFRGEVGVRVGFRPGASTIRGVAFDLLWKCRKLLKPQSRTVYFWIGSDVMETVRQFGSKSNIKMPPMVFDSLHIAGAPWLQSELGEVGIQSECIVFPERIPKILRPHPLPQAFRVMSYVPDRRYLMFGGDQILSAARSLPDIQFEIAGGTGTWVSRMPSNVRFLGWVEPLDEVYERSSLVIRILEHDGIGATVKEGLVHGRHVICSYPLPFTRHVRFGDTDALVNEIVQLKSLHDCGNLRLNLSGRDFVLSEWDENVLVQKFVSFLRTNAFRGVESDT